MTFEEWFEQEKQRFSTNTHGEFSYTSEDEVEFRRVWEAAQPKWLPIDTIPLGVKVLVYGKDYGVSQAVIYFYPETSEFNGLTHWQPLPTPPLEQ
jgi:hypothetical protein